MHGAPRRRWERRRGLGARDQVDHQADEDRDRRQEGEQPRAAQPAAVFDQVNDFHKWDAWSPWAKLDRAPGAILRGPTGLFSEEEGKIHATITRLCKAHLHLIKFDNHGK